MLGLSHGIITGAVAITFASAALDWSPGTVCPASVSALSTADSTR